MESDILDLGDILQTVGNGVDFYSKTIGVLKPFLQEHQLKVEDIVRRSLYALSGPDQDKYRQLAANQDFLVSAVSIPDPADNKPVSIFEEMIWEASKKYTDLIRTGREEAAAVREAQQPLAMMFRDIVGNRYRPTDYLNQHVGKYVGRWNGNNQPQPQVKAD